MILHRSFQSDDVLHPTEQDVVQGILGLLESAGTEGGGYVVLADDRDSGQRVYGPGVIQAVRSPGDWVIEYRDRGSGKWYRSPRGLSQAKVMALFHAFYRHDDAVLHSITWTEATGTPTGETPAVQMLLWLVLTVLVVGVAFWKL